VVATAGVIIAATGGLRPSPADASFAPTASPGDRAARAEVLRIQSHFDSVLAELATRDVSTLSAARRAARTTLMHMLERYRDRAVFPHNYDFSAPTPYFIDRKTGTLCAVAHLLESTGRRDIVDRVARTNNNVWVAELASDTALASWLNEHGVTLAEAARIQGRYLSEKRDAERTESLTRRGPVETSLAPILPVGRSAGTGLSLSVRF